MHVARALNGLAVFINAFFVAKVTLVILSEVRQVSAVLCLAVDEIAKPTVSLISDR